MHYQCGTHTLLKISSESNLVEDRQTYVSRTGMTCNVDCQVVIKLCAVVHRHTGGE